MVQKKSEDAYKKILNTSGLVTTVALNAKSTEIENKIPSVTGLVIIGALNLNVIETENKIPDTSHFINTQAFSRLTKISFNEKTKEAVKSLASKNQANNALDLENKIGKKTEKLQKFDSSYFIGKSC